MKKKKPTPFNVIVEDVNKREFVYYDIMPYLMRCYDYVKRKKEKPTTFDEFKSFVNAKSMYMYWARCQYELILRPWVSSTNEQKIDVYWQIKMNLDVITQLLMKNLGISEK